MLYSLITCFGLSRLGWWLQGCADCPLAHAEDYVQPNACILSLLPSVNAWFTRVQGGDLGSE